MAFIHATLVNLPSIKASFSFLILGRSGGGAAPNNPFTLFVTKFTIWYSFSCQKETKS